MFQQLYDLIGTSTLMMTLSREGDGELRINVIPRPADSDPKEVQTALSKGLSMTGSIADLDANFVSALTSYSATVQGLRSTLEAANAEIKAAEDAAKADAAKKVAAAKKRGTVTGAKPPASLIAPKDPDDDSEEDPADAATTAAPSPVTPPAEPDLLSLFGTTAA